MIMAYDNMNAESVLAIPLVADPAVSIQCSAKYVMIRSIICASPGRRNDSKKMRSASWIFKFTKSKFFINSWRIGSFFFFPKNSPIVDLLRCRLVKRNFASSDGSDDSRTPVKNYKITVLYYRTNSS